LRPNSFAFDNFRNSRDRFNMIQYPNDKLRGLGQCRSTFKSV